MNKGKITGLLLAGAMVMSAVAPMSVHASALTKTGTVPVTYKAGNIIQPEGAKWGVMLPSAISFNDNKTTQDVDVELVALDGAGVLETTLAVDVAVASGNAYKLVGGATDNKVAYTLNYDKVMTDTVTDVATLTGVDATTAKKAGTADLVGTATSTAERSDTLTYTVTKK